MTNENFTKAIEEIRNNSLEILRKRNANYSKGSMDALHNFHAGAAIMGCTPAQCAWGYMTKHLTCLRDKVMLDDFKDQADLFEKCTDIINYVAIIYAIGVERNILSMNNDSATSKSIGLDHYECITEYMKKQLNQIDKPEDKE